ncbi:heat shock protein DnaJ domain protein [Chloroherpeton thalassium ATCC 35110]|uniref:Heat shock protein DnaJ domain protein n=1 Tax=Chloroherpeton thalassium (strain ATCC 35110 / GB-78) TaxID=517418 RepID=B3QZA1_CHLT3|nr:J domain-containing protein [Chloroherpeton thalassium]ACF13794.1 heat shock protein DnaJ domain protein [Chloroherpeton thalassium ATCC 35110]
MDEERTTSARFKNYYEVLRVRPYDSPELIQAAFLAQIKQWHPDRYATADEDSKAVAEHRTKLILEARHHLCHPDRKSAYDQEFAERYPKRFEKLSNKARPKERKLNIDDLLNRGASKNLESHTPESCTCQWYDFSTRINRRTKQVVFNASHFLEANPTCDVRFRFNYNQPWTPFDRSHNRRVQYGDLKVALAEMQARYVDGKGRVHYAKPLRKVIILSIDPFEAMREKALILEGELRKKNRLALKVVSALVGVGLFAVHAIEHKVFG